MNIALLIGISDYQRLTPLKACSNDLKAVKKLLDSLEKYDDFLVLDSSFSCYEAKQLLIEFIEKHKYDKIEEFILYYSGHGDYDGSEFYYLWSDYYSEGKNQTSISNSELDSFIKKLSPEMTFKIIDACQSGISYIKDKSSYQTLFDVEKSNFKKCYFFFSSLSTQSSFANTNISFFTEAFLRSFNKDISTRVRYRDIKDYISDYFSSSTRQTPFFIEQADNTEYFCTISDVVSSFIKTLDLTSQSLAKTDMNKNFIDLIKEDAKGYCSQDEANKVLNILYDSCEKLELPNNMDSLFTASMFIGHEYKYLPQNTDLAKWFDEQPENTFFVKIVKDKEPRQVIKKKRNAISAFWFNETSADDYQEVTHYVDVINTMEPSTEQKFAYISIKLDPKYPNINGFEIYIVVMLSQIEIAIFSGIVNRKRKNWESFEQDLSGFSWDVSKQNIRELMDNKFFNDLINKLYNKSLKIVENDFQKNNRIEDK